MNKLSITNHDQVFYEHTKFQDNRSLISEIKEGGSIQQVEKYHLRKRVNNNKNNRNNNNNNNKVFFSFLNAVHSSAFYFHFPSTSPANFIEGPTLLQMNKFSLCFWLQTARRSIAILSYAVKDLTGVSFFTGTSGGSNCEILRYVS